MPSKPPTSKAQKGVAKRKTAKKLPSNIAKRFKLKKLNEDMEDERWKSFEEKGIKVINNIFRSSNSDTLANNKNSFNNKRSLKQALRENIVL